MSDFAQAIVDHLVAQDNWGTFSPTDTLSLRDVGIDGVFDLEALAEFCTAYLKVEELQRVVAKIADDTEHAARHIVASDAALDAVDKFSNQAVWMGKNLSAEKILLAPRGDGSSGDNAG